MRRFSAASILLLTAIRLPAQAPASLLSALPPGAVSAKKSFVIANSGQAYFYNPSARIERRPFLAGVHRPFGFSYDNRYFLYLKSNGTFPGFALYRLDLTQQTETRVGSGQVISAAWSPTELKAAYVEMDSAAQFRLVLQDFAAGTTRVVETGRVDPDSVAWSADGQEFVYVTAQPDPSAPAGDLTRFRFQLNALSVKTGTSHVVGNGRRGAYLSGKVVPVDALQAVTSGNAIYSTVVEGGKLVVKSTGASGSTQTVAQGSLYTATDEGIVLQQAAAGGPTYQYVTTTAQATPLTSVQTFAVTAVSPYKLPFGGSSYLVQGGADYNSSVCDGGNCLIVAHFAELGFALDWQQHTEEGQGNDHVLATDAGTVVATYNSVTCNTATPACPDYSTAACDPNYGAGNYIAIAHADGTYSFYGHLKGGTVQVTAGQAVTQGTFLAVQGHSGSAGAYNNYLNCGDHVHFQRQGNPAVWSQSMPTDFADASCALSCTVAYTSQNTEPGGGGGTVSVVLNPASVSGATTTTGNQVTLSAAAPTGGTTVTLTSANPSLASVPASVTVQAGSTSAPFSITTQPTAADTSVLISASTGSSSGSATLTLKALTVSAVNLTSTTVQGGTAVNGNGLDLTGPAGSAGFAVTLASSNSAVASVPASVTVAAGSTTTQFDITTSAVTANTQVTISATGGGVTKSAVLTVTPPGLTAPTNPNPADGATGISTGTTLSWSPSTGATSYDVYFGTTATPPLATNVTGTSWSPGALTAGTTYHWNVVAKNAGGTAGSATWSFTTAAAAPGSFANLSPANGATGVSTTPALSWSASSGATSYDVYFGTTATPPLATNVTGTTWSPAGLSAGTTYYWNIVAKNGSGTATSATWSFTTASAAPGNFNNVSPANGATGVALTPALSWSASSGATSYDVYFGTTATPPLATNVTGTTWSPPALNAGTTYYWNIVAKNSAGTATTATWSFTTAAAAPGAFNNLSPANGATGVSVAPALSWSASSGATSYDVYFGSAAAPPLATNVTVTSWAPGSLNAGATYYWRVVAKNSAGTATTATWSFTTAAAGGAPGAFSIVFPTDGSTGVTTSPRLEWTTSSGATSYSVYLGLSTNPGFNGTTTGNTWLAGGLQAGRTYYWRIVATNSAGSTSTPLVSFTTAASPPGSFNLISPRNGQTSVNPLPALSWSASSGATFYDVYLGTSPTPAFVGTVTGTTYTPPSSLSRRTTYRWRVVARNSAGTRSSSTWSFTTN